MRAIVALVALLLLAGQGIDPLAPSTAEKSNAPAAEPVAGGADPLGTLPSNPPAAGSAPIGTVSPAGPATGPAAKDAAKSKDAKAKAATAAAGKPEVLPWEGKPKTPPAAAPDPKTAAASPCNGLIEAGCREQKKSCAWIGDMKHEDGSIVPGRCAPRAVKKAQAAKPKPKPAAAAPAEATSAPAATGTAPADPAATPAAAPTSPVTITVNPPAAPADPAAEEGIPQPAQPYRK